MKKTYITHKLASIVTTAILASSSIEAYAQGAGNFSNLSDNIVTSASGIPKMISTVAYIGGVGLGVAGIFKLKQHVDNPGNTPMKDGLVRLGAGGGLLALPYMTDIMTGSISAGGGTAVDFKNVSQFNTIAP